jgi:hypothetical protein
MNSELCGVSVFERDNAARLPANLPSGVAQTVLRRTLLAAR